MTQEAADETTASEEVKELKQKVSDLEKEMSSLDSQLERLKIQEKLLTDYSRGLFAAGKEASTADLLDEKTIGKKLAVVLEDCTSGEKTFLIETPFILFNR